MADIPQGRTKEDIKARERVIKDFYASWIAEHPTKQVMNVSLGKPINVKFLSINETYEKASRSYESTLAVFRLTEILENAILVDELPTKRKCITVPQQMPQTKNKATDSEVSDGL